LQITFQKLVGKPKHSLAAYLQIQNTTEIEVECVGEYLTEKMKAAPIQVRL